MSIVTKIAVFFALNPDEELSSLDVAQKYNIHPNSIGQSLRYAEVKGWVNRIRKDDPTSKRKWRWYYTAGPNILKELGR